MSWMQIVQSVNLLETRPSDAMAFSKEAEVVVRDGAMIRMTGTAHYIGTESDVG
jgi:hypothetical protein